VGRAVIVGGTGAVGRAAAAALGYTPAGDYATTVAAEVDWLTAAARSGDDADLIPGPADDYFATLLDYPAEDRWLAARTDAARTDRPRTDRAGMERAG
jgi:FAD/FMN-containing dehydrogenase